MQATKEVIDINKILTLVRPDSLMLIVYSRSDCPELDWNYVSKLRGIVKISPGGSAVRYLLALLAWFDA